MARLFFFSIVAVLVIGYVPSSRFGCVVSKSSRAGEVLAKISRGNLLGCTGET